MADATMSSVSPLSAEDTAAQAEAITVALKKQADWDEKNDKAIGSIKLRLSPAICQKTLGMTSAKEIWTTLKNTYGKPGVSAVYTDFKRATSITIPNDANPSAMIKLICMHFNRGQAHLVHGDMSPMMHTVTFVDTPTAVDSRTKRAINLACNIGVRPSGETVAALEDVVMSNPGPSSFTPLTPAPRPKRTLTEHIYWNNLQSSSDGWGCNDNWNDAFTRSVGTQTDSDADMGCVQEEDASWNEDTLVNTLELGSVFGSTTMESGLKVPQDTRTPVPLIDCLALDPAAKIMECGIHLGERFQNPEDPLHIYGEGATPFQAVVNTCASTGTLSLVQRLAAVHSEMQSGSLPAHPSGMTTQSLPSSRVASPTPGMTSMGWEWLTPHLENEDGRYDELLDWQRDATVGLGGMEMEEELPSRVLTPSSMPELQSMSPSLSSTSDLEYMSTLQSLSRMSHSTDPREATLSASIAAVGAWSDGIPSQRPSTPTMVIGSAANNYGWSLDSEVSGMDNGYLRSYE
ncbi:hypothetical protein D9758_016619 [Tetrapyrgos nigripes]|uniref:Uncharacterized protein n=1 Tax=Tetrapyrgos nigripes TaxID=182062 RepID=A0A8H5C9S9_9AGAR|nr:hypothetical protein D9758_016619 [Tetrapyrgos nigripes]